MSHDHERVSAQEHDARMAELIEIDRHHAFGPLFFLGQLHGFVSDRCPDPGLGLPVVELTLADHEVLDLCHVMAISPGWVALAVHDGPAGASRHAMRTELVPYGAIFRVTVRSARADAPRLGFEMDHAPHMMPAAAPPGRSPEDALRDAAGRRDLDAGSLGDL